MHNRAVRTAQTRTRRTSHRGVATAVCCVAFIVGFIPAASAQAVDPEIGRLMEGALQDAENFRKQVRSAEYEATMRVQEWNGRGRLRGTAKAVAIMRPGDAHPMTFVSREMHGKVRLPDENDRSKEDEKNNSTLFDFAREHRIADRFEFKATGIEQIAGDRARRIEFSPKPHQPEKSTADRFLDSITGAAWVTEGRNRLVKFEMRLLHPFQLFWIFAVLKECSIEYELIEPGEILGHAKLKVTYALTTPIYSIRQQHDVDLNHFRRRASLIAGDAR